jgi:hypothetical protein
VSPSSFERLFPPANEAQRVARQEVAEASDKGHGRREHRRLQASDRLSGQLDWPDAAQVCRLVRRVHRNGKTTLEVQYAVTSVPRSLAGARQLLAWWRGHWSIENRLHYVRDVALAEDASRIRKGHAPQNLAALRNGLISWLRLAGHTNLTAALRACTWQTQPLLAKLGILKQ